MLIHVLYKMAYVSLVKAAAAYVDDDDDAHGDVECRFFSIVYKSIKTARRLTVERKR